MSQRKFSRAKQKVTKDKKEKSTSSTPPPSIKAMVWYREENWEKLLELFVDSEKLPSSYKEWYERAVAMQKDMENQGHGVIKVYIDPETFPQWCETKGLPMDSEARSQLAIEVAQAQSLRL